MSDEAARTRDESTSAGARWWSVDIHTHSPASFDFGGLEGQASTQPKPSFDEWLKAFIDAGLDGVVVTDHNTHAGIDQARAALAAIKEKEPELDFVVFPGVEITVHTGIHILGVFDPSASSELVNQVITLAGYTGERGRSDQTGTKTVLAVAEIIAENGGVCVLAHADQNRGALGMDPRDIDALAASPAVRVAEIVDDNQVREAAKRGWVALLGSDAHHLSTEGCPEGIDPKAPGTHFTRVKVGSLDLEGLRLALTDADQSILRSRLGQPDPNHVSHATVRSLTVRHAGETRTYRLSAWMTCLIGGRGVGKSMVLELLRLALGRSDELVGRVAEELERYSPHAAVDERWWDSDTQIVVDYRKDGRQLRITWSGARPRTPVLESWTGEEWEPQSGAASDRAPIRMFSQKQIFDLATSPQSLLAIVDDLPEIDKDAWSEEYEALELQFKTQRGQLRQLRAEAEKAERTQGQLEDVRGRLAMLAAVQEAPEYDELTRTEQILEALSTTETSALELEEIIAGVAIRLRELVGEGLARDEYSQRTKSFESAAAALDEVTKSLSEARVAWSAGGQQAVWEARVSTLSRWLAEQVGGENDASQQIARDRQRETELIADLAGASQARSQADKMEVLLVEKLKELRQKRDELFDRRKAYVEKLDAAADTTQVRLFRQGQTDGFGAELRRLLHRPELFDSAFANDGLANSLLAEQPKDPRYPDKVEHFKQELIEFVQKGRGSTIGKSLKADNRFFTHVAGLDEYEIATEIMLWFPEDQLEVRHKPRPGANFEAVDRGSPGQRTAALLAVILQMGTEPLLLDQPEDDLENKLIKSLIVESLKRIKANRQVVVATHNANVVVTSGAENIVVLGHGSLPVIESSGTLQSKDVRDAVCLILEGGEDAIRDRYRRLVDPVG